MIIQPCTRSSMDRIPDSGSDDVGSIPAGCTKKDNTKPLKISGFYFNRASKERPNQNKITLIIPNCRIKI